MVGITGRHIFCWRKKYSRGASPQKIPNYVWDFHSAPTAFESMVHALYAYQNKINPCGVCFILVGITGLEPVTLRM